MRQIHDKLRKCQPIVESIHKISGSPGLAIGVYQNGKIVHEDYYGLRDVERKLPVDRDTIFHVASLTKAITAAAVGILVDRGDLSWNTPVDQILPFFKENPSEKSKLIMPDFLSHRTGTTWGDALYLQSNNNLMLPKSESPRTFQYLPTVAAPRSGYLYNNHAYNIPGFVIEEVAKQSYGAFLQENIFDPLKMTRTFTKNPDDPNVALPYNILSDGTPFQIPFSEASSDTIMFSAVSVRTTMADILQLYGAMLERLGALVPGGTSNETKDAGVLSKWYRFVTGSGSSTTTTDASPTNPIKQAHQLFRPHSVRSSNTLYEQTSALGWNRTQLPGRLEFGWNSSNVAAMPLFGKGYPEKLALWHGGNMPGSTVAAILLPETQTAIVVMQNSLGLCDAADLTAQLLLDCLFLDQPQHDYVALAKEATKNGASRMEKVAEQLEQERESGTDHRPLEEYTGIYENAIKNWVIHIGLDESGELFLRFQGRLDEEYKLRHYNYDVFAWNLSYDETVKRAQYCRPHTFYRFYFESQNDRISFLRWHHDPNVAEGEVFTRRRE